MGDRLFKAIISIIRLASYTLELLAVRQILYHFDHHNCAAKVQFYPLHNLAWSTYCWGHRRFVTCSVLVQHLYVTCYLSVWVWESSFLSVLVLLAFPRPSAGCTHPSLGPCLPGCTYLETLGKESCSHHYLCPTECKPSRTHTCRVTHWWRGEHSTKLQLWVLNQFGFLHARWLKFLGQSPAVSVEVMTLSSPHSVVFHLFL